MPDLGHTATVDPSLGGQRPRYFGNLPNMNPHFLQSHSAFFSLGKSHFLSRPTLSCHGRLSDPSLGGPCAWMPSSPRLPSIPTPHRSRAAGKLPAPALLLGEKPSLDLSLLPGLRVCPTSSSQPPLHQEEHGGIVPQDRALPWGLAPCPGGGPGTKRSKGGAGCPLLPSQPPWACLAATLPSPRWDPGR